MLSTSHFLIFPLFSSQVFFFTYLLFHSILSYFSLFPIFIVFPLFSPLFHVFLISFQSRIFLSISLPSPVIIFHKISHVSPSDLTRLNSPSSCASPTRIRATTINSWTVTHSWCGKVPGGRGTNSWSSIAEKNNLNVRWRWWWCCNWSDREIERERGV